ncbi:hypothetical protein [Streptomyces physcomitrii]|uniref:Secreted protein n=1 Tax=Streptomyces physcomitrii TaxID=2724184 RepID=A0ABX1GW74_9ACTN|nr:hypothetical protein [Streptomyces physcomitrii]NKI40341.1 hypothetical protein [Streptomyces physcomitrii]
MKMRRTNGHRALTAVALAAGMAFVVAGCGGGGDDEGKKEDTGSSSSAPAPDEDKGKDGGSSSEPGQSGSLATVQGNGISLTVTSAERDQGGFLTLAGKVTNNSSGRWIGAEWISDEQELKKNGGSLAGASLVDTAGKKKYLVLRDTQGRCLCTKFQGGIGQGDTIDWYAQFPAPPEDTAKVQLQLPTMPPASVALSGSE